MASWDEIREEARAFRAWCEHFCVGEPDARALLKAADKLTGFKRERLPAGHPLLAGAEASLDPDAARAFTSLAIPERWVAFCEAHEYAHYCLECGCLGRGIEASAIAEEGDPAARVLSGYGPQEQRERECNVFACEFFLPSELLFQWFVEEELDAEAIAQRSGMPVELVLHQLAKTVLAAGTTEPAAPSLGERPLDKSQRRAAMSVGRPTLVTAGAGTGKTRALVGRIDHLLGAEVPAESMLAITYSKRAAQELRERVHRLSPDAARQMWLGTFHAFGLELLRKYGSALGLDGQPKVIDAIEAEGVLETLLPQLELQHYRSLWRPTLHFQSLLEAISRAKDELASPTDYHRCAQAMLDRAAPRSKAATTAERALEVARVYAVYEAYLAEQNLLDFGDLILKPLQLLAANDAVRAEIQARYPHILVDEYQDTNRASGALLKALAGDGRGLWVVGDVRQAIYRFRGAAPENVARFEEDFPGAEVVTLRRNYRSQPPIIDAFSHWAKEMNLSKGKEFEPWEADRPHQDGEVRILCAEDEESEAAGIAHQIRDLAAAGIPLREQAILCQTHTNLERMAALLGKMGVPVLYLGDVLKRLEVSDLLSVLALAAGDAGALVRIAEMDEYRMPVADLRLLLEMAREPERSVAETLALARDDGRLSPAGRESVRRLAEHLGSVTFGVEAHTFLASFLFGRSNMARALASDTSVPAVQKRMAIAALLELARSRKGARRRPGTDPKQAFLDFIRHAAQRRRAEGSLRRLPEWAAGVEAVRLMTVHAAKGLEFRAVFLPRMRIGHFPTRYQRTACPLPEGLGPGHTEHEDEDEEECVFFVALSRARDVLVLSRPLRVGSKKWQPSEFLDRIGSALQLKPASLPTWVSEPAEADQRRREPAPAEAAAKDAFDIREVNLYLSCPKKFFYEEQLGLPRHRGDSPHLHMHGSIHGVMDWVKSEWDEGREVGLPEALRVLGHVWERKGPRQHPYDALYRSTAEESVGGFLAMGSAPKGATPKQTWRVQLEHGTITCTPDLVRPSDGAGLVLRQVRTGKPKKEDAQDPVYALLARGAAEAHPGVGVKLEVAHLATDTVDAVEVSAEEQKEMLQDLNGALRGIRSGAFPVHPRKPKDCPQCAHYFVCPKAESV